MFDSILIGAKEKVPTCGTLYKNVNRFVWNFLIRDDNKFCRNDDDNGVTYLRMTMQPRPFRIECNLKSKTIDLPTPISSIFELYNSRERNANSSFLYICVLYYK